MVGEERILTFGCSHMAKKGPEKAGAGQKRKNSKEMQQKNWKRKNTEVLLA